MTRLDVLSIGEVIVDFFPEAPGRSLRHVDRYVRHLGGAPANVAVGVARLGRKVGLCALVGRDDFGDFLHDALVAVGVDTRGLGRHPTARTGVTFVSVDERGERSFSFHRHGAADQQFGAEHVDPELVAQARIVHVGSTTSARPEGAQAIEKALAAARAAGAVVSCDPNWRPHMWRDPAGARQVVHDLVARATVVKLAEDELEPLLGLRDPVEAARRLRSMGPELAVVTRGALGCVWSHARGEGTSPAVPVTVVDTTGAGDAFCAGLLAGLAGHPGRPGQLSPEAIAAVCAGANATAARVLGSMGATAGFA
jgi:fructokinase